MSDPKLNVDVPDEVTFEQLVAVPTKSRLQADQLREEINRHVAEFLASGGEIEVLESGETNFQNKFNYSIILSRKQHEEA